jgi:phenylpyruvate tautomerase PptA (4-oxalocrotonate tautomerase family)
MLPDARDETARKRQNQTKETIMPVVFIEAPPGIRPEAKTKMVEKITGAIDEAYHIGDTLIFLREYPAENVAMDGKLQSENPKILEALKKIRSGG